jgi:transcriptional regulator PpsR
VIESANTPAPFARFSAPDEALGGIDAAQAGAMIALAGDIALIVDSQGVILDAAFGEPGLPKVASRDWIGRRWADIVTVDSRPKIEELLRDATQRLPTRWRQVDHTAGDGADIPVRFSALGFGSDGRILAVGRDLRALGALQQRLAEAQQGIEREYARIRNAERRYRVLFQLAAEAVLIVDAAGERILEANPAAAALLGVEPKKLLRQAFSQLFSEESRQAARSFLAAARIAQRVDNVHVRLERDQSGVLLTGSPYRQDGATHLLVLLSLLGEVGTPKSPEEAHLLQFVEAMPEAFVVIDLDRRILTANPAFLDLIQATTVQQVRGEPIQRWIGRPGVEIDVLFANLRAHANVRRFSTVVRGEYGATEDVEIAAASLVGVPPHIGLAIRVGGWRDGRENLGGRELPRTVEQFTHLVGRVPMKNLVHETTDLIERLCIQAALELTRDNRASAAEMLGLSRQALYSKLRRYGLGDLGENEDSG